MKGSHNVIIETERMKYEFTIRRNITVILGDSATGKTTLVEFLNMYARRGKESGVTLSSDVPCIVLSDISGLWKTMLAEISGSIVFIDEGQPFIFSEDFAKIIQDSDNYYVLITRRPLYNLPYSTKEIYGIRTTGKYHFPEKVYQEFYPIYTDTLCGSAGKKLVILEDSNSGYEFFNQAFPNIDCMSSGGNSRIASTLIKTDKNDSVLVIADGAAFGAYIESILVLRDLNHDSGLYLPESFEWLILKSGIINKAEISDILDHPEDYIDSSLYLSWERFFTDLLEKETSEDKKLRYSKTKLNDYYISNRNIQKVLQVIPEEIRHFLDN